MGYSASRQNVLLCLAALESALRHQGWRAAPGAGVEAARAHYAACRPAPGADPPDTFDADGIGRI